MPAAIAVPAIMSAVGTAASVYSSKKASDAAKLDPVTQAYQRKALAMQNARMEMMQPLLEGLVRGMPSRLARSQGGYAPSMAELQSPGASQAVSQLSRGLPSPTRRVRETT